MNYLGHPYIRHFNILNCFFHIFCIRKITILHIVFYGPLHIFYGYMYSVLLMRTYGKFV